MYFMAFSVSKCTEGNVWEGGGVRKFQIFFGVLDIPDFWG